MPDTPLPSDSTKDSPHQPPPDLRLVTLTTGSWLGILAASPLVAAGGTGPAGVLVMAAVAGIAGVVVILVARRGGQRWSGRGGRWPAGDAAERLVGGLLVAGVLLLGLCCGGVTALRVGIAEGEGRNGGAVGRLVALRSVVRLEVTVSGDPRPIGGASTGADAGGHAGDANGGGVGRGWWVAARWESFVDSGRVVRVGLPVTLTGVVGRGGGWWRGLLPGERVGLRGRVGEAWGSGMGVAAVTVVSGVVVVEEAPAYQRAAGRLREGLRRACVGLPGGVDGLLPGLVDGDTSGLDDGVRQRFLVAGMSHLTAVSGANLAVVLAFVVFVGRWVRWGARVGAVVGLVATAGFVVLVRPDPSVLRAAAMGGLGLVGVVLRRPGAAVPGLAAGVFVLLVVDPGLAGSAGFALSALATVGLLLFGVAWRDRLRRCRVPAGLAEALSVPLAAQVACAPVIAGISGSVGVAAVPANVLAEPAVAPATVLGVGAAAVSPVSPWLAHALAWLAAWPCRWLVLVAGWSDRPASLVPWPSGTSGALLLAAALLAVLLLGTAHRVTGWALLALAAGALPAWLLTASWPHPT